jgi:hypothetical protein
MWKVPYLPIEAEFAKTNIQLEISGITASCARAGRGSFIVGHGLELLFQQAADLFTGPVYAVDVHPQLFGHRGGRLFKEDISLKGGERLCSRHGDAQLIQGAANAVLFPCVIPDLIDRKRIGIELMK